MKIKNKIIIHDNYALVVLTNRNKEIIGEAIIDLDDIEKIKEHKYHITNKKSNIKYAQTSFNNKSFLMHQIIMNQFERTNGLEIDHIDGNGLNNRKENLRLVTHKENMNNKKAYKKYDKRNRTNKEGRVGVLYNKDFGLWEVDYGRGKNRIQQRWFTSSTEGKKFLDYMLKQ